MNKGWEGAICLVQHLTSHSQSLTTAAPPLSLLLKAKGGSEAVHVYRFVKL
ncbi:hypothetical protein LR013_00855 [candidate division NPL-UPA2 bacterium]|nr:hypothetical protein [candidate division NPL-UPA2 bacterium]